MGRKWLLVSFVLRNSIRPYSYALSVLNEESETHLLSPNTHGPLGRLFS